MKEAEITNEGRHHLLMISGHISCWPYSYRGIVVCVWVQDLFGIKCPIFHL